MFKTKSINLQFVSFGHSDIGNLTLPFGFAQGGESFDSAQDREPVERPVEPFGICDLLFGILFTSSTPNIG